MNVKKIIPASWSSGNAFVSGARGPKFKSRAGQFGHSVVDGSPPLRHFFKKVALPGHSDAKIGAARYTPQQNTMSKTKDLI